MDKFKITSTGFKWINRTFSKIYRHRPKLVALDSYIYIVGGYIFVDDDDVPLIYDEYELNCGFVERYDTADDSLTKVNSVLNLIRFKIKQFIFFNFSYLVFL